MFTFGWSEIFLIGIIVMLLLAQKIFQNSLNKLDPLLNIQKMSSEFKSSINEIAEEEEIKELAKSVKEAKKKKTALISKILK